MAGSIRIYGKDECPYTTNARTAYTKQGYAVEYINVRTDSSRLAEMLQYSGGRRVVPVIVTADGAVTIGYGGT
jgi:glutaredoxin